MNVGFLVLTWVMLMGELKTGADYVLRLNPEWITEKEKRQHTDVGQNSWGHIKCAQHAAHNPKFEKTELLRQPWWWHLQILKGPPTWLKVATTSEIEPQPLATPIRGKIRIRDTYPCTQRINVAGLN